MTIIDEIEKLNAHAAAEIRAGLWPVRVGPRTIQAVRRSWSAHDLAAVDLLLRELGWRLTPINRTIGPIDLGPVDPRVEPLFQVVPVPPEERPEKIAGYVPCDMCGHWSSDIDEGLCPGCRDRSSPKGDEGGGNGQ